MDTLDEIAPADAPLTNAERALLRSHLADLRWNAAQEAPPPSDAVPRLVFIPDADGRQIPVQVAQGDVDRLLRVTEDALLHPLPFWKAFEAEWDGDHPGV